MLPKRYGWTIRFGIFWNGSDLWTSERRSEFDITRIGIAVDR
jgi:hypothetical protein